jgi:hypothetical protein
MNAAGTNKSACANQVPPCDPTSRGLRDFSYLSLSCIWVRIKPPLYGLILYDLVRVRERSRVLSGRQFT